jgi:PAS domain S-box-containing protein
MTDVRRLIVLAVIMAIVALVATGMSIGMLYRAAMVEGKERLTEIVQSQARLIEAVARFDAVESRDYPGGSWEGTLSQIRDAHSQYRGFGDTGEFTLAKLEGGMIVFLLSHRHCDIEMPKPVPFNSELAEPMRRALSGLSGTVVGYDYRGVRVLAAYEPLAVLNLGIVAKIDIREIRAPFIRAGIISAISAMVLISLGVLLFHRISNPILERIRESERRYRYLFDHAPDVLVVLNDGGEIVDCNTSDIYMIPREELIGRNMSEFLSGDFTESFMANLSLLEEGGVHEGEVELRRNNDNVVDLWYKAMPLMGDGKSISEILVYGRDITDRKRNREKLQHLNLVLRSIRNVNQLITQEKDPARLIQKACDEMTETRGFVGAWIALFDGDGRFGIMSGSGAGEEFELFKEHMNAGNPAPCLKEIVANTDVTVMNKKSEHCGECPIYDKSDSHMCMASLLFHDGKQFGIFVATLPEEVGVDSDEISLFSEVAGDIAFALRNLETESERDTAVESLQESETKYRLLADNTLDVIWVMGLDLVFTYVNPSIEKMFGYTQEEWVGSALSDHCTNERFLTMNEIVKAELKNIEEHSGFVFETVLTHKEGHDVPVEIHGTFLFDKSGKLTAIQGTTRDITERKNAERLHQNMETELRQAQKMEAVGRLAGGIAHDFNNMLGVIHGYSELALRKTEEDSPIRMYLHEILQASKRSSDLTRQLLTFSRKEIIQPRVVNLNDVITEQRKILTKLIGEDIAIDFVAKEDLWNVKIDPIQIDQILANLSVNARDAIGGVGSIIIETDNVTLDEAYLMTRFDIIPGDYVMMSFSDTGEGMDTETMESIFEPFFTTKNKEEGTGLGLATIYGIVKQNDGAIHVYSELEHGTTFKIYLPRCRDDVEDEIERESIEFLGGTETVLIVEDEAQVLSLAERILNQLGYTVFAVRKPVDAISFVESYNDGIDLLLTDVVMPEMNGKELERRIGAHMPDIKTLYMSGYTANVIAKRGVLDEGVDFIRKPFSVESLSQKVREVLDS